MTLARSFCPTLKLIAWINSPYCSFHNSWMFVVWMWWYVKAIFPIEVLFHSHQMSTLLLLEGAKCWLLWILLEILFHCHLALVIPFTWSVSFRSLCIIFNSFLLCSFLVIVLLSLIHVFVTNFTLSSHHRLQIHLFPLSYRFRFDFHWNIILKKSDTS